MAVVDTPWDGAASRWPDTESFCKSCAIDVNPSGGKKVQSNCKLPYKEPSGAINRNALGPAAAALNGARSTMTGVNPAEKKRAARELLSAYREAKMDPPDSLKQAAKG